MIHVDETVIMETLGFMIMMVGYIDMHAAERE